MSHFQVSRDLDESLSSLSRLGWVTFKSLKTWMRSGRWRCSSEDPYTPGLWQVCYSSGQARGTLLHPPSALPLGSPGDGVSKQIFLPSEKSLKKTGKHLAWQRVSGQGDSKKFESIRIKLRDLAQSQVCPRDPGLLQPWIPGTRPGTSPGIPSKLITPTPLFMYSLQLLFHLL